MARASQTDPVWTEDRPHDGLTELELSADRANQAIVMAAKGAIDRLLDLGWKRRSIGLEIPTDDPLPCWVTLRKRRVFQISLVPYEDGSTHMQGEWVDAVRAPTITERFMGH